MPNATIKEMTIQLKRATAAVLAEANPTPAAGEAVIETDTGRMKIGDGTKTYTALPYVDAKAVSDAAEKIAKSSISSENATNGAFSTTADASDAETVVSMTQLRILQTAINDAKHSIVDNYASTSTTDGLSANKGKDLNDRLTTVENYTVVDGGVVTVS